MQPDVIIIIIIIIRAWLMLIIVADAGVKNSSADISADFFSTSSSHERHWANEHAACLLCKDLIVLLIGYLEACGKEITARVRVWCYFLLKQISLNWFQISFFFSKKSQSNASEISQLLDGLPCLEHVYGSTGVADNMSGCQIRTPLVFKWECEKKRPVICLNGPRL